jgi:hypothetical protein
VKWLDPYLLGDSEYVVFIDTDVLFFDDPVELHTPGNESLWQKDIANMLHISPDECRPLFGIDPLPPVNSGIGRVKRSVFSTDFAIQAYRILFNPTRLAKSFSHNLPRNDDQTFHALLAARAGDISLLPTTYLISDQRGVSGLIAKHYVGSFRFHLWEEGIPQVARLLNLSLPSWLRERP